MVVWGIENARSMALKIAWRNEGFFVLFCLSPCVTFLPSKAAPGEGFSEHSPTEALPRSLSYHPPPARMHVAAQQVCLPKSIVLNDL